MIAFMCLALTLCAGSLSARQLKATADHISLPDSQVQGLSLQVDVSNPDGLMLLQMNVETLRVNPLKRSFRKLAWHCALKRSAQQAWSCDGELSIQGMRKQFLSVSIDKNNWHGQWREGARKVSIKGDFDNANEIQAIVESLPLQWFSELLKESLPDISISGGELTSTAKLWIRSGGLSSVNARFRVGKLGFESSDGLLAAAGIAGKGELFYTTQPTQNVRLSGEIDGGEFFADPIYVPLPKEPITFGLTASLTPDSAWRFEDIQWLDHSGLIARGSLSLTADNAIDAMAMQVEFPSLAVAKDRYLSGILAPLGFSQMALSGQSRLDWVLEDGELTSIDSDLIGISAIDASGRFVLVNLNGDVFWSRDGARAPSSIEWGSAAIYGIGFAQGRMDFINTGESLLLSKPTETAVLDGSLKLNRLIWTPAKRNQPLRLVLGMDLRELDLNSLSQRLGWPPFKGTLSGRIPAARYENNQIVFEGGLNIDVFDGQVSIRELAMERPFGVAPTLSADISMSDLDLQPLTEVFGFGEITGRLDGRIDNIRMVNWTAVAFDARFDTDRSWKGKRRISQRAVRDISSVGGSGLIAGLQNRALSIFSEFSYAQIGFGCRLRDNVCFMDGLGSAGDGYIIVQGSGLPQINVVGFRKRVDWPTLVDRLKAATQGQSPQIN